MADEVAGTLITVAPVAGPIGHLLRTAIDAEQVGATRLHLAVDQPDLSTAVSALREQTRLVLTCDSPSPDVDVIGSDFVDATIQDASDLPGVVAEVARLVAAHPAGVGICGRGAAALPALLAALAAGGHLWVDAPEHDALSGLAAHPRDHAALVARASGLARIAGRPPLDRRAARTLLGLA
jgi:hypothetical protein